MKYAVLLAATTALALTACQKSEDAATEAATVAEATDTAAAAPAGAAGEAPSKEFIVGKWGEPGECELALEFNADGTMIGPFEKWTLDNGVLDMEGNPQKIKLKVVDANTMESQIDSQPPRQLTRCP